MTVFSCPGMDEVQAAYSPSRMNAAASYGPCHDTELLLGLGVSARNGIQKAKAVHTGVSVYLPDYVLQLD